MKLSLLRIAPRVATPMKNAAEILAYFEKVSKSSVVDVDAPDEFVDIISKCDATSPEYVFGLLHWATESPDAAADFLKYYHSLPQYLRDETIKALGKHTDILKVRDAVETEKGWETTKRAIRRAFKEKKGYGFRMQNGVEVTLENRGAGSTTTYYRKRTVRFSGFWVRATFRFPDNSTVGVQYTMASSLAKMKPVWKKIRALVNGELNFDWEDEVIYNGKECKGYGAEAAAVRIAIQNNEGPATTELLDGGTNRQPHS